MISDDDSNVVDLRFHVVGDKVPVDHGYLLYSALSEILESGDDQWLHETDHIGLIPIRGQYMGNGQLKLSKRATFGLRLPATLVPRVLTLAGKRLVLGDSTLRVGTVTTHGLAPSVNLYAHITTTKNGHDEARFDTEIARQLNALGIKGEPLRGERRIITIRGRKVVGYSLLVTELTGEESIRLQEQGIGGRRKMGCGLFLPARSEQGDD